MKPPITILRLTPFPINFINHQLERQPSQNISKQLNLSQTKENHINRMLCCQGQKN